MHWFYVHCNLSGNIISIILSLLVHKDIGHTDWTRSTWDEHQLCTTTSRKPIFGTVLSPLSSPYLTMSTNLALRCLTIVSEW